ncbi:unnamed protein product [Trichobilharzia regenti]|nr:unnamed protein product [Trichobilharzia regenti]
MVYSAFLPIRLLNDYPYPLDPQLKEIPFQNETSSPSSSSSPPSSPSGNLPSFFTHVKTTRTLGKKPITQLAAISEFGILLALAEGRMSVYQLPNCQLITSVRNSKGASLFAYCMEYSKTSPGQGNSIVLYGIYIYWHFIK